MQVPEPTRRKARIPPSLSETPLAAKKTKGGGTALPGPDHAAHPETRPFQLWNPAVASELQNPYPKPLTVPYPEIPQLRTS